MKEWGHIFVATALAVLSLSIFILTHTNDNVKPLDFARFYSLRWIKPDTGHTLSYIRDPKLWLSDRCQRMTNLSDDAECLAQRTGMRDNILRHMRCDQYGSQVCSFLKVAVRSLAWTSKTAKVDASNPLSPYRVYGLNMNSKSPSGQSFTEILQTVVQDAPRVFHGAYKAEQSDNTLVLRSALFNLIAMAILGNLIVHIIDSYQIQPYARFWARTITFILVVLTALVFIFVHPGNVMVLTVILVTSFVTLVYFELYLNETIVRPWIHPFVFSIIYQASSVLALTENGVLDYNVVVVQLLFAVCASQLFMAIVWYWVGHKEKLRLSGTKHILHRVYLTKEVQQALLGTLVVFLWIPLQHTLAPYDYTLNSLLLLSSPLIFVTLAVFSTLFVEEMHLGDEHGEDSERRRYRVSKDGLPDPNAITGGKLAASALLLLYGTFMLLLYFGEHLSTFRAYQREMPPPEAVAVDSSRQFLFFGPGLSAA